MKKLLPMILIIGLISVGAFCLAVLQIETYRTSYSVQKLRREADRMNDQEEQVKARISHLKSPDRIENLLPELTVKLSKPAMIHYLPVSAPEIISVKKTAIEMKLPFSLPSLVSEAHARLDSNDGV